jgi:hypothetical protein
LPPDIRRVRKLTNFCFEDEKMKTKMASRGGEQGCQIFWYKIPKRENITNDHKKYKKYKMTTKCTTLPQNVPHNHKMYQITAK